MRSKIPFMVIEEEVVYGLTELHRDDIRNARLVANLGCYPTSVQLPLVPLVKDVVLRKQIFTLKSHKVSSLME
ncbi:unnamed protein product [Urochloa humidicola]